MSIEDYNHIKNPWEALYTVIQTKSVNEMSGVIQHCFKTMEMHDRDVGAITNKQKHKSLTERYYTKGAKDKMDVEKTDDVGIRIERGRLIAVSGFVGRVFVVTSVGLKFYNKWALIHKYEDHPVWPITKDKKNDAKKYRIHARELVVDKKLGTLKFKQYCDVGDQRINELKSYIQIDSLDFIIEAKQKLVIDPINL